MILFIQIPCYNEEHQLSKTLNDLPSNIKGVTEIKKLIIDDGSTDKTIQVAIKNNVDFIISNKTNKGLAKTFEIGLKTCVSLGADIVVNTDADNQYCAKYINDLVTPIINNQCDLTVGCRPISSIKEFSFTKKTLQIFGSFVVRKMSGIEVKDVTSGFRAYSRSTAERINIISKFTYTIDTIIQAGQKNFKVLGIPIKTNKKTRRISIIQK